MSESAVGRVFQMAGELARLALRDLVRNRWLVLASILAGVVLWAFIEDVENPRLEAVVPSDSYQPIPVESLNLPDGLVLQESLSVRVVVKASADDVPLLTADDFTATIDARDLVAGETVPLTVNVESKRSDVRVVGVRPSLFLIRPEEAATSEFPVTVSVRGDLPAGFRLAESSSPAADPPIAMVTGRAELVDTVAKVEIELNITGVREETFQGEGELVARTAGGNRVDVAVVPARARATVAIEQVVAQRTVAIQPFITGEPADGYRITSITIEPAVLTATGPTEVIEGLHEFTSERTDISGAQDSVIQTKKVVAIPNVSTDVRTVVITVGIAPFQCGSLESSPCGGMTVFAAPTFSNQPEGLALVEDTFVAEVRLLGPLAELVLIEPGDLLVSVSLANTTEGPNLLQPTAEVLISGTDGVFVDLVNTITVTMIALPERTPTAKPSPSPTPEQEQ